MRPRLRHFLICISRGDNYNNTMANKGGAMLKKTIVSLLMLAAVATSAIALSGCETCKGMGRDVSNVGKMISGD